MIAAYREWVRAVRWLELAAYIGEQMDESEAGHGILWADTDQSQAPEIQTMYNVPLPVSVIRTRMRQEFERHRFINKLSVVDVLLFQSDAEYQVFKAPDSYKETLWQG